MKKSDIDSRLLAVSYTHFDSIGPMVHEIYTKGQFEFDRHLHRQDSLDFIF